MRLQSHNPTTPLSFSIPFPKSYHLSIYCSNYFHYIQAFVPDKYAHKISEKQVIQYVPMLKNYFVPYIIENYSCNKFPLYPSICAKSLIFMFLSIRRIRILEAIAIQSPIMYSSLNDLIDKYAHKISEKQVIQYVPMLKKINTI